MWLATKSPYGCSVSYIELEYQFIDIHREAFPRVFLGVKLEKCEDLHISRWKNV